ncbi:MAG: AAA family ATPase, partial [Spirochaetia bacterium]|nr:AAA family ATPase [Spirochaetia bacterium]
MRFVILLSLILAGNAFYFPHLRTWRTKLADSSEYRKYPFSQKYFERYIKRLNSKNITDQSEAMFGDDDPFGHLGNVTDGLPEENIERNGTTVRIIINKNLLTPFLQPFEIPNGDGDEDADDDDDAYDYETYRRNRRRVVKKGKSAKSDHFELVENSGVTFKDVGGYDVIKAELEQCIDLLKNYTKYARFNVRTPKGLILEGLPGNGKTLLAKALAGEARTNFIAVS